MKLFALITAGLMTAGGGAYYMHSQSQSRSNASCPVAMTGGCCHAGDSAKPICCTNPCPACSADCLNCCDACELCCSAGVQTSVSASTSAKPSCCAATTKAATAKADCCAPGADCCFSECCFSAAKAVTKANCCTVGADCCLSACCFGAGQAIAKPTATADEDCCAACTSPATVATSAVLAGIGAK